MNKNEFLDELGRTLSILEDGEQRDILEEYAQHIDMKVSAGLSEEEAIRDFGSMEELTAQILEAYHVKPEYRKLKDGTWGKRAVSLELEEKGKQLRGKTAGLLARTGHFFCLCGEKLGAAAGKVWHLPGALFGWAGQKLFWGKTRNAAGGEEKERKRKMEREARGYTPPGWRRICRRMGEKIAEGFQLLWRMFLWCVRLGWNCLMGGMAALFGFFALGILFLFAILLVWLLQGYPFGGITLACFGGLLCTGACTVLCLTFMVHKCREESTVKLRKESTVKLRKGKVPAAAEAHAAETAAAAGKAAERITEPAVEKAAETAEKEEAHA